MDSIKKYWKIGSLILFLALAALGYYIYHWEYRKPVLEVRFFSLNKGRGIFMRTPENKTLLIGGGQNSEIIRELTSAMPFYRRAINTVVIPSATPAQIGGLIEVIGRYEVGEILMPKIMATSTALFELMKEIRKQKIHIKEVERGDGIHIEKDLTLKVLFPYEGFKFNKTSLPELGSVVEYGKTSAYLLGNLSKVIQKDILKSLAKDESKNIVEYYHSGGDSKVSEELKEFINPSFVFTTQEKAAMLVSDGEDWNKK